MMKTDIRKLNGIITPMITPFKNGKLDVDAVSKLLDLTYKAGVSAVFPAGSTGVFPFLTVDEHISLIKETVENAHKGMAVVAGVGRNSLTETLEVAKSTVKLGVHAVVVMTPYYIKLDDKSLFRYFDVVAGAIDENIMLYNIPQFTGNVISPDIVLKLAEKHSNIIGIKDSSGSFGGIVDFLNLLPNGFQVFQGQDYLLLPSLMLGAAGGVCGTTNFSDLAVRVYKEFKSNHMDNAKRLQISLTRLMGLVNSSQFPAIYNFMFYMEALGRAETNAVPPISSITKGVGAEIYRRAKTLM